MSNEMTPGKLQFLIHYHCAPGDYEMVDQSQYWKEVADEFLKAGLIVRAEGGSGQKYQANREALGVYIEAVMAVPLPVQKWVIPA